MTNLQSVSGFEQTLRSRPDKVAGFSTFLRLNRGGTVMTKRSHIVALAAMFALTGISVIVAAQQRPNRVTDQQVTDVLSRMDTGIAAFRSSFDQAIDRNRINGSRAE